MAFVRDHGTCCVILPLKLGVGIVSMLIFISSLVCILALVTGDIRFQPNGYNPHFFRVPSAVGAFGLIFGFVGLLGIYDDKLAWVRAFNLFFAAKIVAMVATTVADYYMLYKCDSWLTSSERLEEPNVQIEKLAEADVCPWARWSYLVGAGLDLTVWLYFAYCCYDYQWQLEHNPPYAIDFGRDRYSAEEKWRFYHVKDPRAAVEQTDRTERMPVIGGEEGGSAQPVAYGSMPEGPYRYGPDGMPVV